MGVRLRALQLLVASVLPLLGLSVRAKVGDVSWSYETGAEIFGSAAVASDGSVFFGSRSGNVYALNSDGSEKWIVSTGDWVDSSPALSKDESVVYAGSWDNKLYALATDSGAVLWTFTAGSLITASPALDDEGNLYFGSSDGFFYSVDSTGELRWFYFVGAELDSSPAVSEDGHVYVGAYDGNLYSFTGDGELRWTFAAREPVEDNDSRIAGPIAIGENGEIYFGSADGYCYAVTPEGELDWEFDTLEKVDTGVVIGNNGELILASRSGTVYALDRFGVPIWESFVGDVFFSTPAVDSKGRVYLGSYVGNGVSSLNVLEDGGDLVWDHLVVDYIDSPPVIDHLGRVIYGCYDGALYVIEADAEPALSSWHRYGGGRENRSLKEPYEVSVLSARFGEWIGELGLEGVFADPCFDAEEDGYPLALEYLVGGDPAEFDRVGLTSGVERIEGVDRLWLEHDRVLGDSEVSFVLEYSVEWGEWEDLMGLEGIGQELVNADLLGDGWYERVRLVLPTGLPAATLFRLRMACD
ncbi:PQQ-binding-like beta-propeller repeat protein [Pelagicoccus mobilis]|uniref:PQQ-like beta-propeller repeat protein n=1 Tax=Pelagicoccus mobilis TaxID=415221 RepID=A0A934RX30_9BACT|nr:PQQ-binding-like beta-propeller repeat protein [Pelagicoccus mobilis]MBK1877918.1 PQQ-like beta-propeller repeat protein [Pelagicoccus mobilis]